jgi:hypothetical protein
MHVALLLDAHAKPGPGQLQQFRQLRNTATGIGRRLQHDFPQHRNDLLEHGGVGGQALRIPDRVPCQRCLGLGECVADGKVAAVRPRREVEHGPLEDPESVFGKAQVADDLRVQEADGVAGERVPESRMEFLGHSGPTDHVAPLEHGDPESGPGEVTGAGQAVVAGADDEDVGGG